MGRGDRGKLGQVAARLGASVVESTALCHIVAFTVTMLLAFVVAVNWNRAPPFDLLMPYATPAAVRAGESVTITFRLSDVKRDCEGDYTRWFVDSLGKRHAMGSFPTVYNRYVSAEGDARIYDKQITIPIKAACGPGVYESFPRYWCNPAQMLFPIIGPPVRISINVSACAQ